MALVAINAVVHVPVYIRVAEVCCVVVAMASGALEYGIVIGIGVARGANAVGIAMGNGELGVIRVRECRASPGRRGVAGGARSREELRLRCMARIGGVVVVRLMAADAGRRQGCVIAVDVAQGASRCRVGSSQRERRVVVIERGICPDGRVMAEFAGCREAGGCVGRVGRAGVILLVAGVAERAV